MTSSYNSDFAEVRYGRFLRVLWRWRASVYKVIIHYLAIYIALFYALKLIYCFALNQNQQYVFKAVVQYCSAYGSLIPMSFIMSFYLTQILKRWWEQYLKIPWPDPVAVLVSSLMLGNHEAARLMRRTVMRYLNLSITLTLICISPPVKKRFYNDQKLIDFGLLNSNEAKILKNANDLFPKIAKYWMPLVWACSVCIRGRREGVIRDDFTLNSIMLALEKSRQCCQSLLLYDLIPIPLVYTQVVTLVCYSYFMAALVSHQFSPYCTPILLICEFVLYMGLLKVAETTINPFGEDDEDYELNWFIDRNLQVSYVIVDEMHNDHPEILRDAFWEKTFPDHLYYGNQKVEAPPSPSTAKLYNTPPDQQHQHGIHTLFERKHKDHVSPKHSFIEDMDKDPLLRRIPYGIPSSELSLRLAMPEGYIDDDSGQEAFHEEEEEGWEEDFIDESEIGPDAFELLRAERQRNRMARQSLRFLPFKLNTGPSFLKISQRAELHIDAKKLQTLDTGAEGSQDATKLLFKGKQSKRSTRRKEGKEESQEDYSQEDSQDYSTYDSREESKDITPRPKPKSE